MRTSGPESWERCAYGCAHGRKRVRTRYEITCPFLEFRYGSSCRLRFSLVNLFVYNGLGCGRGEEGLWGVGLNDRCAALQLLGIERDQFGGKQCRGRDKDGIGAA
jgi:hypothetical protein